MAQKKASCVLKPALMFLSLVLVGCGDAGSRGRMRMQGDRSGLSMYAPAGWNVDKQNPGFCFSGDCSGLVIEEMLEGRDFHEYAETCSNADYSTVLSRTPLTVSGCEAIEAVIEYRNAGSKALKVYIHKGDMFIEVSFVTPQGEFPQHESSLRKSVKSIEIK